MSGTIVTSAPRRSSSSASGFASGRVTTIRRPESGWLSHGSPPVCGPRPRQAPPLRVARRAPAARPPRERAPRPLHRPAATSPWRRTRGVVVVTASAATGAAQPPPSARRNARSAVVSARAAVSSSAARSARSASSSERHWIASAPCPGAGSIVSAGEPLGHDALEAEPLDSGRCEHDGVVLAVSDLADARVDVPADRPDLEVGAQRSELRGASQAARADDARPRAAPPASRRPGRRGSRERPRAR